MFVMLMLMHRNLKAKRPRDLNFTEQTEQNQYTENVASFSFLLQNVEFCV